MELQLLDRIIVPLDTSVSAEAALPWAALVARDRGLQVHLLSVWDPDAPIPGLGQMPTQAEATAALRHYLGNVACRRELSGVPVESEVRTGNAAAEITACAWARPNALVMLTTRGTQGYQERQTGSLTEKLMEQPHLSLLVLRGGIDEAATTGVAS